MEKGMLMKSPWKHDDYAEVPEEAVGNTSFYSCWFLTWTDMGSVLKEFTN